MVSCLTAHAQFFVTNTNVTGAGSLIDAIAQANTNPEADLITFNIPNTDPNYINSVGNSLHTHEIILSADLAISNHQSIYKLYF